MRRVVLAVVLVLAAVGVGTASAEAGEYGRLRCPTRTYQYIDGWPVCFTNCHRPGATLVPVIPVWRLIGDGSFVRVNEGVCDNKFWWSRH